MFKKDHIYYIPQDQTSGDSGEVTPGQESDDTGGTETTDSSNVININPETGILLPEEEYSYGSHSTNIPVNYIEEYAGKKVKVTFNGVEYTLTVNEISDAVASSWYVGEFDGQPIYTNYPFFIRWEFSEEQEHNVITILFENIEDSHIIKIEKIINKKNKKNLVSALKKLLTAFGGEETNSNNAVDIIDKIADSVSENGGSSSEPLEINYFQDPETGNLACNHTYEEIVAALEAGKQIIATKEDLYDTPTESVLLDPETEAIIIIWLNYVDSETGEIYYIQTLCQDSTHIFDGVFTHS